MGSNFSLEGITKDLEAMKDAGIGGATIFNLSSAVQESHAPTINNPWPEQTYRSTAYWKALRHAAAEADRLDLEIGLHNTVGYSTTGGPWIDEERSMQHLVWSDTTITGGKDLVLALKAPLLVADEGWGKTGRKLSFYKDLFVLAVPAGKGLINPGEVLDISSYYDTINELKWKVPRGKWTIYRIGHASTGRPPHPVPDDLLGKVLEADKMSKEQTVWHWQNVLNPVKENLGEYFGKSFRHMLIDSYEAGNQNWTAGFREEFIKLKGYDPLPWLVSFTTSAAPGNGSKERRTILSEEQTKRFTWDYRDVISHLFHENGWETASQMLHNENLKLQFEPYGGPFNTPDGVALADLPMAEFWTRGSGGINPEIPAAARAAGKNIVGAEAFTGRPEVSQYTEDPAFLKPSADMVFAQGINRLVLHHWVHQPFDDKYQPGMGMGWWGTHFGRNQTWFEPGKAFFSYLGRCQALLQYGEQVAGYLCVDKLTGYSDLISTGYFLENEITVSKGKIILPSGRTYPFMLFSDSIMLPEVAGKIRELVSEGATVVSPKPVASPSMKNYPGCDSALKKIADEVWGNRKSGSFGKGFIFTNLDDAVREAGNHADHIIERAQYSSDLRIAHRKSPEADIWFIANLSDKRQNISVSLDVTGKLPELWQAEDGSITDAPVWNDNDKRTTVELSLKGIQSVFVVFRKPVTRKEHPVKELMIGPESSEVLTRGWQVSFYPKTDQPFKMDFQELVDFSKHPEKRVRYFSGTSSYKKNFRYEPGVPGRGQQIFLDLGEMNDIAKVRLNGKDLGVLWYPPYRVNISGAIKRGNNEVVIEVTNNWANRLIGDEQEPPDFEWGRDRGEKMGRAMLAYPDWFIKDQPRPSQGRKTFSIWYYYRTDSPLQPAGLVGPVRIISSPGIKL